MPQQRRDEYLRQLQYGHPHTEEEIEANYAASQRISAYGANPSIGLPAGARSQSPYWIPSAPTDIQTFLNLQQSPPQVSFPPGVPNADLPEGFAIEPIGTPGQAISVKLPGQETTVQVSADQAGLCACLAYLFQQFERRLALAIAPQFARAFEERLRNIPLHTTETPNHEPPYTQLRADVCTPRDAPVGIFDSAPVEVVSRTVPNRAKGTLEGVAMVLETPLAADDVQWTLMRNHVPIRGWENIRCQIGTYENPYPLKLPLEPGDIVSVEAQSLTTGNQYNGFALLRGWDYFPRARIEGSLDGSLAT